ncbi:MAG: hypothetical protein HY314_10445 [Acidobacteria bacterium]|nr:hypothetical protein [Acidobacteriota bacterium]
MTGSGDIAITDIHVWNGDDKINEFTGLDWSGGMQTKELFLGNLVNFSKGMGVSIRILAGVEAVSHRFVLSGAGARFE